MESVLFKGAYVVGIGTADVGVRDGRIDLVGAGQEDKYDRVFPAGNYALLPGLINTHGHAAMSLLRSVSDDLPLKQWLEEKIWPLEAKLSPDSVYWGTMLAIAEVKATSADGEVSATASVSVSTPATGLSLTPSSLQLKLGQTKKLTATLSPQSASDKRVTWSSNKPEVVQVDSSGMVTAQGNGTATISVKTVTGKLTASTTITVTTPVSGVTLNKTSLNLKTGQTTQLTASIQPAGASEKGITWSSNKPAVATVSSSGLVTAKGKGTAVITVTTKDGSKTAKATITVTELQQTGTADELLMLSLVNEEREKAGLGPLMFNIKLTEVARIKSQDMIDNKYFAHDSPTYGSPFEMMKQFGITYRYAAENLALHPSVESAHQGLMNSPGHRANILNPNLTEIGIGIIPNSQGRYYVTQMFIGF